MGPRNLGLRAARRVKREVRRRLMRRRLRAGEVLRPGPSWVQVGVHERCNYHCSMCSAHARRLEKQDHSHVLPEGIFKRLVAEVSELGTQRFDICGLCEPLLDPGVLDRVRLVKAAGMRCVLITNGSRLDPAVCDSLIEIGLDSLNVSLNSATDETHHRITEAPAGERSHIVGMLEYLVENRDRRGARRPCVCVSFIVHRENCGEIRQIAREAIELGLDNVEFAGLGINEASRELALSREDEEEVRRQAEDAQEMLSEAGVMTNARRYLSHVGGVEWSKAVVTETPCCIGQFYCRVLADGQVNPCGASYHVVGDVTRERMRDVWCSPAYRAFRREAFSLPKLGRPLERSGCYTCGHAQTILDYHEKLSAGLFPEIA